MTLYEMPAKAGSARVKIEGQLDFAGAAAIRQALASAADHDVARMVIDLAGVTTADDKGIASLALAVRKAAARHPAMRIVAVAKDSVLARALSHAAAPFHSWVTVAGPNK